MIDHTFIENVTGLHYFSPEVKEEENNDLKNSK